MRRSVGRTARIGVAVGLVGLSTLTWVSAAFGTAPGGSGTTTALNRATIGSKVEVEFSGLHLEVNAPIDVVQTETVGQPGFSSGWHSHTGAVIVSIKSGALVLTDGHCRAHMVSAGQAFVESPGVRYQAENRGTIAADWFTTQLIPKGAATRVDQPAACGAAAPMDGSMSHDDG